MKNLYSFFTLTTILLSQALHSSIIPTIATNQATHIISAQINRLIPIAQQTIPYGHQKAILRCTPNQLITATTQSHKNSSSGLFKPTSKCLMSWQYKQSPYQTLGISKNTKDLKIIKNAYLNHVKKVHPDRPNGSEKAFIQVNDAYKYLEWSIKNNRLGSDYDNNQNTQQNSNTDSDQEDENEKTKNGNNTKYNKICYPLGFICSTCTGYKLYKDIINKREKSLISGLKLISKANEKNTTTRKNNKGDGIVLFAIMSFVALRETYYGATEIYDDFIKPYSHKH